MQFNTNSVERMRINSSGNVGIGTTSPDAGAKLTVAGAVLATGAFSATTGSSAGFDYFGGALRLFAMGTSGATKGAYTFIAKGADGSSSTPMTIDADGTVRVTGQIIGQTNFSAGASGGDYPSSGYNFTRTATSAVYNYTATDSSSRIEYYNGGFIFYSAPSGTGGNVNAITYTERARINTSGLAVTGTLSATGNLSTTGTLTVTGAINALTDTITSSAPNNFLANTYATANAKYIDISSTGNVTRIGAESSSSGSSSGTGAAYDTFLWSSTKINLIIGATKFTNASIARISSTGVAVTGTLSCTGALSKGSGSFRIEHPLPSKSATHQLVHSFIEGPKCDLIYRGKVDLVDGKASVNIDAESTMTEGTFEALCTTVQCFTSNESGWGAIRGKVIGNILTIEAQDAASTDNVSWMVIGERKDKHILDTEWTDKNGRPIIEPLKPAEPALESK